MCELKIERVTLTDSVYWRSCIEIYRESFPDWEREPEDIITKRVQQGRYLLFAGIGTQEKVVGFYILDLVAEVNYVLFSFLAVTQSERGKGYGTFMCKDATPRFKNETNIDWLLIEAENRQAIFYGKLGFRKLTLDYKVPKFGEPGSVMMHLMTINAHEGINHIQGNDLTQMIERIFLDGYHLSKNDNRVNEQIALIPKQVKLISWP